MLPSKIRPLFDALHIPASKYPFQAIESSRHALNPLLVPTTSSSFSSPQSQFIFEQYQYTTLGNAVIQRAITKEVCKFFVLGRNAPLSASPNATKQLISCFHNALSVRFVAESLPLAPTIELSSEKNNIDDETDSSENNSESKTNKNNNKISLQDILSSAKHAETGPSRADKRGTSFDWAPVGYSQSDLGPRLTHFIGCIELYCGREIAQEAARRAFFDLDGETSNLPYEAAQLLATLSKKYNPQNVSKALLAAQGLNTRFVQRSIVVQMKNQQQHQQHQENMNYHHASQRVQQQHEPEEHSASTSSTTNNIIENETEISNHSQGESQTLSNQNNEISTAFSASSSPKTHNLPQQQKQQQASSALQQMNTSSHAFGPGKLNMMKKWEHRVLKKQLAKEENNNNNKNGKTNNLDDIFGGSGWNNNSSTSSAATATASWPHRTTQPVVATNADRHGVPDIISNVQRVSKKTQETPVIDDAFFDKNANKDGVEFSQQELSAVVGSGNNNNSSLSTNKNISSNAIPLSSKGIISTLSQPHERFFEVSFVRDPIIDSTRFRREVYATDVPKDFGAGRKIPDFTKDLLFGDDKADSNSNNASSSEKEVKSKQKVGPKVLAKGVGKSFGEARMAASMNYLQGVISDLSVM